MAIKTDLVAQGGSPVKGALKVAGFMLLVVGFVPVHLVLHALRRGDPLRLPMLFHGMLSRLVGFRVRVRGEIACRDGGGPILYVSNHSSYLDIPVLGAIIPGCFVAKSEVNDWPFIGMMARFQNTVFIERRSVRASAQRDVLRERLEEGGSLILFPEGTSSDGNRTLPFKSSLFSIVEKPLPDGRTVRVQPVSIVPTEIGGMPIGRVWRPYYAWFGDMTLMKHVWEFFKIGSFTVDVVFHDPVSITEFGNRKLLSDYCQRTISEGVNRCVTGRF